MGCSIIEDWQKLQAFQFPISDTGSYCLLHHLEIGTDAHLSYLVNTGAFPDLMCPEPKADSPTQHLIRVYAKLYMHFTLRLHSMVLTQKK